MHFLQTSVALAALASLASSAPTKEDFGGFTIHQVATGKKVLKNGAQQRMKTYEKFGAPVPHDVKLAAAQSGSVTATPEQYDQEYLCPVSVGTPGQTLMLDFDSGSSDLWVYSSLLSSSVRSGHSYYDPTKSSTSRKTSGTWSISYGDGSGASGVVYYDKVVIGGVTATSQAVEAATSVSAQFQQDVDNDGLVGLAFDSINSASPQVKTFMDNVGPTLNQDVFTASLKKGAAGSYDFGVINSGKYSGSIYYTSISTANGFWEFSSNTYYVGGVAHSSSLDLIADTGTSLIYMPDAACNAYYSKVSGASYSNSQGGYIFPCGATLPSFGIAVGGSQRTVPGSYMNYAPVGGGSCFGGIQSSDGIGFNILGDVFLKSQFVVFDVGNKRLGFANQA